MTNGAVHTTYEADKRIGVGGFLSGVNDRPSRVTEEVAKLGEREGEGAGKAGY